MGRGLGRKIRTQTRKLNQIQEQFQVLVQVRVLVLVPVGVV